MTWWRDAVIYQVYVRSFADTDGDGVGDLPGIVSRLPYIQRLGVDAIWLNPFYPSPQADGGYDVSDYRDVEPRFGTLADFDRLVAEAHRLGLRVIVDIVPNHTSSAHVWFQEALGAEPGSSARARYIFREGRGDGAEPPNNWASLFGGPAWTRVTEPDGEPGQWYLHLFDTSQPDLDWSNPEVGDEFESTLRFWLDRGADGFRIDVANALAKHAELPDLDDRFMHRLTEEGHPHWDRDEVHEVYRRWRRVADEYDGDRAFVAEAWLRDPERLARYLRPDELHTAFNFHFLLARWDPKSVRKAVDSTLDAVSSVGAPATWVLSNHDVTRHVTRYGGGRVGERRARAAALLMLALPGSAYIYQGEELGLPEVEDLPDAAAAGPDIPADSRRDQRTRRMPRPDALVGRRAAVRLHDRAGGVAAAAIGVGEVDRRTRGRTTGLHALALPRGARAATHARGRSAARRVGGGRPRCAGLSPRAELRLRRELRQRRGRASDERERRQGVAGEHPGASARHPRGEQRRVVVTR